jgi:16S rRNA (guanine527-N7)-methyltransferase
MSDLDEFDAGAVVCGVSLSPLQRSQLHSYLSFLEKWNRKINLTSVEKPAELLRFHFLEACWVAETFLTSIQILADIGSGAGFPGMVVKLYRPQTEIFLIEKNYKKALFLTELSHELSLQLEVFSGSAESFPGWNRVDAAVVRALHPSAALLDLLRKNGIPLLILHGHKEPASQAWELVRREKFPLSANRWASLYRGVLQA